MQNQSLVFPGTGFEASDGAAPAGNGAAPDGAVDPRSLHVATVTATRPVSPGDVDLPQAVVLPRHEVSSNGLFNINISNHAVVRARATQPRFIDPRPLIEFKSGLVFLVAKHWKLSLM